MAKINVVIIDSGVTTRHSAFKNDSISVIDIFHETDASKDEYGHGTAIYGIIRNCPDANIYNIKINNIENGIDIYSLEVALQYVLDYIPETNIINLSLGTNILFNDNLYHLCDSLSQNGVIIVSAFDNANCFSFPAAFDNVIGVITDTRCKRKSDFIYVEDTVVNIAAKGGIQRVCWNSPEYIMLGGNSFACAHVTAQIVNFMKDGIFHKKEILERFQKIAIAQITINDNCQPQKQLFPIGKAILFPFNKEMHSLIRYHYLLPFEITGVYDVKYAAGVGAKTTHLLKDTKVPDFLIKSIECIDYDKFDTLILGHTNDLFSLVDDKYFVEDFVNSLLKEGKNVYSFDDHGFLQNIESQNVYIPRIDKSNVPASRFGMLYRISKPVLGIFGTSSIQGKFTLQLKLRELLLSMGYRVGQIGTEPSSVLFGMDYVYPMGYNASVYISEYDSVRYLNYVTYDLSRNNDIVIVGSQSGSVTFDFGNINQWNASQYSFMCGTQPDCVILCVNPFDDIGYIQRSINFIESSVDSKVIALVLYPLDYSKSWSGYLGGKQRISEDEFRNIQYSLERKCEKKVFLLGEEGHMQSLVELIVNFFTE